MENIFDAQVAQNYINRINTLNKDSQRLWGTMTAPQMLAHLNVSYELVTNLKSISHLALSQDFCLNPS